MEKLSKGRKIGRLVFSFAAGLIALMALGQALLPQAQARLLPPESGTPAPAFTHTRAEDWINSPPLKLESLRGKVVLLDFWTFACWNCYRSFPWLNPVESRLRERGLVVIGVHSPEFDYEKVRASIQQKVVQYGLTYPVMIDSDMSYWNSVGNRYWPAFYLIDRQGRLRANYAGETHAGDANAQRIEADLDTLLAEPIN